MPTGVVAKNHQVLSFCEGQIWLVANAGLKNALPHLEVTWNRIFYLDCRVIGFLIRIITLPNSRLWNPHESLDVLEP